MGLREKCCVVPLPSCSCAIFVDEHRRCSLVTHFVVEKDNMGVLFSSISPSREQRQPTIPRRNAGESDVAEWPSETPSFQARLHDLQAALKKSYQRNNALKEDVAALEGQRDSLASALEAAKNECASTASNLAAQEKESATQKLRADGLQSDLEASRRARQVEPVRVREPVLPLLWH